MCQVKRLGAKVMESSAKLVCFKTERMAFIFRQKHFHFPIFVHKKSAGHFEIHNSVISSVKLKKYDKNGMKYHQPSSSCFTSSAFLLRKMMLIDRLVSQCFAFPHVICSPQHWALVLCVPPSPPYKTIQCYVFPIYHAGFMHDLFVA